MAHAYLKQFFEHNTLYSRIQRYSTILGSFLLANSYLAKWILANEVVATLTAMGAALLLGLPLMVNAILDLAEKRLEMNELAALSFAASFATTEYRTAGFIAFFMLVSNLLEYRSQVGARKSIEALLHLSPAQARIKRNSKFEEVEADSLRQGDIIEVLPGDNIPGDGSIIEGLSTVNEAAITGESVPVEKRTGDQVFAGTINMSGRIEIAIAVESQETVLSKIKCLITQAEQSKTPAMRLINRYIGWYTPIILMVSAIVLFFTRDIERTIAMLVISCPCIILISSPTAIVAALNAAARLGVIIKSIPALESAARVSAVVFDKTGTLTKGNLEVTAVETFNSVDPQQLLTLCASLEQHSRHPIARSIIAEAGRRELLLHDVEAFEEVHGRGVKGIIAGAPIAAGRMDWIEEQFGGLHMATSANGTSQLYIARSGMLLGAISLSDTLKTDARAAVDAVKAVSQNDVYILTGDKKKVAEKIAGELQCTIEAEIFPEQKMNKVEEIKEQGHIVAVVGDGINDAPALAAGDVSIAMGGAGTDAAIHSASIVLLNDQLNRIPFIIELSRKISLIIKQNLTFSILFIIISLLLSAGGFIQPILAVILHTASSMAVIFNSARLLKTGSEIP
ncbi:MAG: cadmium-translocating P-type ATPase [Chitinivibrionales bacterium]|nr:cadmium-translocating P-type ATPase [Chitinivibrionales bacterium]